MEFKLEGNRVLRIEQDGWADDPRSWDNMTKLICFHKRYNLGDKHTYSHQDYDGWDEMRDAIIKNEDVAIIEPLYLYDHSGITISTKPFGCRWDSGQVGFVIVTKQAIRDGYNIKRVTKEYKDKAHEVLLGEVDTYDKYISGEVYSFTIEDCDGNVEDSCSGFYGYDIKDNGILDYLCCEDRSSVTAQL